MKLERARSAPAPVRDPSMASAMWPHCARAGLPVESWAFTNRDASELEEALADAADRLWLVDADTRIGALAPSVAAVLAWDPEKPLPEPADLLEAARAAIALLEAVPEVEKPPTVDRRDPLARVALDLCPGDEPAAVRLLADARAELEIVSARLPGSDRARLASTTLMLARRGGPFNAALMRSAIVDALTELEMREHEARERAELERPAREAAARLAARAAELRAKLTSELSP